jgi:hypothetical protein
MKCLKSPRSSIVFDLPEWTSDLRDQAEDKLSRLHPGVDYDRLDVIVAEGGGDRLDVFLECGRSGPRRTGQDRFGGHGHGGPCHTV